MLEQLVMRLKGRSWALILPLIAMLALAACSPTPAPAPVEIEKEATKEAPEKAPAAVEPEVVVLKLADVIETPVPVEVKDRQPLQLDVVDTEAGRLHFRLRIEGEDYPPGDTFTLQVKAFSNKEIAETCQEDREACEKQYPEVSCVTKDGRLIILVDSTGYVVASPYAFSVTGIKEFANPITVSISVDKPEEIPLEQWLKQDHGFIIYHEDDKTIEHFRGELVQEGKFFWVTNSDPITRCCKADGHCSARAMCLE